MFDCLVTFHEKLNNLNSRQVSYTKPHLFGHLSAPFIRLLASESEAWSLFHPTVPHVLQPAFSLPTNPRFQAQLLAAVSPDQQRIASQPSRVLRFWGNLIFTTSYNCLLSLFHFTLVAAPLALVAALCLVLEESAQPPPQLVN
jgi:hypothetical protein